MIDFNWAVKELGITNLNATTVNKTNGGKTNYSKSNKDFIQCQIDYFNSNFTDKKAKDKFFMLIQAWLYNYFFKKFLKMGRHPLYQEKVEELSITATVKFLECYNRRIRAVEYLRGQPLTLKVARVTMDGVIEPLTEPTVKDTSLKIMKSKPMTEQEQFKAICQAFIGSLGTYSLGLTLDFSEDESFDELQDKISRNEYLEENKKEQADMEEYFDNLNNLVNIES